MLHNFKRKKHNCAMETGDHFKNGAEPKSRRVGVNFVNLFMAAMLLCCFCFSNKAMGQTWNVGYPTASNVVATLSGGTLNISGTGAMQDFHQAVSGEAPWNGSRSSITKVIIGNGVETVGPKSFHDCNNLASVELPNSLWKIGYMAFTNCTKLTSITIPCCVTVISAGAFYGCSSLSTVYYRSSSNLSIDGAYGYSQIFPTKQGTLYLYPTRYDNRNLSLSGTPSSPGYSFSDLFNSINILYDFSFTPSTSWQTSSSSIQSSSCGGDYKVYRMYVYSGEKYTFATDGSNGSSSSFNSMLTLYDRYGNQLAWSNGTGGGEVITDYQFNYTDYAYLVVSQGWAGAYGSFTLAYRQTPIPTYSVTLDRQSGTGGSSSVTATYNAPMPSATAPSRTGYTFGGYYTGTNGTGTQYYNSSMSSVRYWDISYNTTLYARWTPITYTVSYNGNGNTGGSTASSSHTYDVARNLTSNGFSREFTVTRNYNGNGQATTAVTASSSFDGWATSSSGAKVYNNNQSVSNLSSTNGSTVTLYAKWIAGSVTLPTPTRTDYTFTGWFTSASGGTFVGSGGATYTPTANITIYAQWTQGPYLNLSHDNYNFSASGGASPAITISSNQSWSIVSSNTSWLTASPTSGSNNSSFTMTATANSSTSSRSATVTISGGGITKTINVSQDGNNPNTLTLSQSSLSCSAVSSVFPSVTVTSNVSWTASSSNSSWLTVTPASGSNNGSISIRAAENTSTSSRSGTITVSGGGINRTVSVTQSGATISVIYFPIFDGLSGEYFQGASAVTLKLKGIGAEKFTVFKVNGTTTTTFNPNVRGIHTVEAVTANGRSRIITCIIVK